MYELEDIGFAAIAFGFFEEDVILHLAGAA